MIIIPTPWMCDEVVRIGLLDDPLPERDVWRWKFLVLLYGHLMADLDGRRN